MTSNQTQKTRMKALFTITTILFVLTSCATPPPVVTPVPISAETPQANLPNPASVHCQQQGNRLEIRTAEDGSQSGVCIFPDGSECDEWAYYRGECQPKVVPPPPDEDINPTAIEPTSPAQEVVASDGCQLYHNPEFGYSFHYPADARIVNNDDPLHGISIVGTLIDGEEWPMISISHPHDREEYRPPENVDLHQWLTDHNLLGGEQSPDLQIAGTTAIHFRHARSPQSYAYDRYFFVKSGQLYGIVIGHTGDKEDWNLYNHFLQSFEFE